MQRFDFVQAQCLLIAAREAARCGAVERGARLRNFGDERRYAGAVRRLVRARERRARVAAAQGPHRQFGSGQLGNRRHGCRDAG